MTVPDEARTLARVVNGESVTVGFVTPLLAAGLAALRTRSDIEARVSFNPRSRSYASTIGLVDALSGEPSMRTAEKGRTYSPLARLNTAASVDRCTEVIMDFVYPALERHQALATQVGRVVGELHDNVASHARGVGFSAAQTYMQDTLQFAVVDAGRGMLANVRPKVPAIVDDREAIKWCLEKGHTTATEADDWAQFLPEDAISSPFPDSVSTVSERNPNHHLGEGLWQLWELVAATGGRLFVWSGTAQLLLDRDGLWEGESAPWQGVAIGVTLPVAATGGETAKWGSTELETLARRLGI